MGRVYQRNFADGEQIEVHIVREGSSHVVNITKAGTRQRRYRRTRPNGEEIDVEWSLHHIEAAVAPILGAVDQRWPLTFDDAHPGRVLRRPRPTLLSIGPSSSSNPHVDNWSSVLRMRP